MGRRNLPRRWSNTFNGGPQCHPKEEKKKKNATTWRRRWRDEQNEQRRRRRRSVTMGAHYLFLNLRQDIFVHSCKMLGAPAIVLGAPSNTLFWSLTWTLIKAIIVLEYYFSHHPFIVNYIISFYFFILKLSNVK